MPDLGLAGSWNATSYPMDMAAANSMSGGALMFLVIIALIALAIVFLITSMERFTLLFKTFDKLIRSIKYTLFGSVVVVAAYALYVVCVILASLGSGVNPIHIGLGLAAYAGVTLLGWGASKILWKFKTMYEQYKASLVNEEPAYAETTTPVRE